MAHETSALSKYAHMERNAAAVGFFAFSISYESVSVVAIDPRSYSRMLGLCSSSAAMRFSYFSRYFRQLIWFSKIYRPAWLSATG